MATIKYSYAVVKYQEQDVYIDLLAKVLPANKGIF